MLEERLLESEENLMCPFPFKKGLRHIRIRGSSTSNYLGGEETLWHETISVIIPRPKGNAGKLFKNQRRQSSHRLKKKKTKMRLFE